MSAWRSYQEDILFDDFDIDRFDSILDDLKNLMSVMQQLKSKQESIKRYQLMK